MMLGRAEKSTNRKPNKFLEHQEKERMDKEKQRHDKHLLPIEKFFDPVTGTLVPWTEPGPLPYTQIDVIFNHKNVWANLQNHNPAAIYYHLHDETKWLPLVRDPLSSPHPLLS